MSPKVPIIILILAIPTYFFCRWGISKLNIGNPIRRRFIAIVPTLILSPLLYVGLIVVWVCYVSYYPTHAFDKAKWDTKVEERYKMSEHLIKSERLIGKTRNEVIEILGDDYHAHGNDQISYYLGFVPALFGMDPDYLDIHFEEGFVVSVRQHAS